MILLMAAPAVAREQKPNETLVIAISKDFQPFTFLNAEGRPAGMFVDLWRLWAQKTGRQVDFISSDWKTSLENLKNQKADIHSGLSYSPERFDWLSGSQPFYEVGGSLFYPVKQGKIGGIEELSGQTVAAIRGSQLEQFLKKNHPAIRVLLCDTREELVKVSREGKTKGFIAVSLVGAATIDRMGLSGEFGTYDKILYRDKFHAGILKKNTELLALVNKGLRAISLNELADIEARWIPDPAKRHYKTSNMIRLTPAEEVWLRNHKTVRVGMSPVLPPLKFSERGVIKGIEPDYLNLLSEYTGIRFEYVVCDFSVMDAKVKSGEIDMFISFYIPERLTYMTFTEPLMEFKQVIIARRDVPFVSGVGALRGKKVATVKGVKLYDKIFSPYPDIEVVHVANIREMFKAVSESKADALVAQTFFAGYVIQDYPNLKVAGVANLPPDPYLYAVRKDYPELVGILNKAIASIPREKHDAILQKWFTMRLEYRPNWSEILKWALVVVAVFVLILGLSLFWNRRLAKEIDKRKQNEGKLISIMKAVESASDAIGISDSLGRHFYQNKALTDLFGYDTAEELEAAGGGSVVVKDPKVSKEMFDSIMGGKSWVGELEMVTKSGRVFPAFERADAIKDNEGNLIGLIGIITDITDRKQAEEVLRENEDRYRKLSMIDDLTQLYNSRHFYVQLKSETERSNRYGQPLTLLLLDLDNFKAFNDAYGHVEGDQVLSRLGQVVKRCLRETDSAYRYGGEEFTILLPMTTSADGAVTAERIRTEFKKEIFITEPDMKAHMTLSIGLAEYKPQEDTRAFVHRVDQLMYQGKRNGKDRVCSES
jgi:diguanylate cyclase (GGDEF)-like protein/PAS domain S-box-containing protein